MRSLGPLGFGPLAIGLAVGLLACGLVAWRLGGALGAGTLVGFLVGSTLSSAGVLWQHRLLERGSPKVMQAFALSFLAKLLLLTVGALVLHFAAAGLADWKAYLIAFAIGVLWITSCGSVGTVRLLGRGGTA